VTENFFAQNPNFGFFKQRFGEKWKPAKFCPSADFGRTAKSAVISKKVEKFALTEKKWKPQKSPSFFEKIWLHFCSINEKNKNQFVSMARNGNFGNRFARQKLLS